ncbi:DUF721 domain-containing protein [Janibacter sp. GXQ6167]|uniref:DUF721 domain-containing protein n=1 Tax=Janibacter sp. GXQ6167 TaxID=3240791 RepID=UPI0035256F3A
MSTDDPGAPEPGDAATEGDAAEEANAELAERVDDAASAALTRARAVAAQRGLRPGSRPPRRTRRTPGQPGKRAPRDPALIGDQVDRLVTDRGWGVDVSAGAVMGRWPDIVGPQVAEHCQPVSFEAGVLRVRADSTSWATNLGLMRSEILKQITQVVGPDVVETLRIDGPSAPTWSKGPRRIKGRGPRDTYG